MVIDTQFMIIIIGLVLALSLPLLIFLTKSVQNITPYLYMNARLKAKEGKLITRPQLEEMTVSHSLSDISSILEGTVYGSEMQGFMINTLKHWRRCFKSIKPVSTMRLWG
jgi:hypothetical protein